MHFAGLASAGRWLHREGWVDARMKKRLAQLDTVSAFLRHTSAPGCGLFVDEVRHQLFHKNPLASAALWPTRHLGPRSVQPGDSSLDSSPSPSSSRTASNCDDYDAQREPLTPRTERCPSSRSSSPLSKRSRYAQDEVDSDASPPPIPIPSTTCPITEDAASLQHKQVRFSDDIDQPPVSSGIPSPTHEVQSIRAEMASLVSLMAATKVEITRRCLDEIDATYTSTVLPQPLCQSVENPHLVTIPPPSDVAAAPFQPTCVPNVNLSTEASPCHVDLPGALFVVDHRFIGTGARGLGLRSAKSLEAPVVGGLPWGSRFRGVDEGDGWLRTTHNVDLNMNDVDMGTVWTGNNLFVPLFSDGFPVTSSSA